MWSRAAGGSEGADFRLNVLRRCCSWERREAAREFRISLNRCHQSKHNAEMWTLELRPRKRKPAFYPVERLFENPPGDGTGPTGAMASCGKPVGRVPPR